MDINDLKWHEGAKHVAVDPGSPMIPMIPMVLVLPTEQRRQHLANVVLHKLQLQSGFLQSLSES